MVAEPAAAPAELKDVIERDSRYVIGISYPPGLDRYPGLATAVRQYGDAARAELMQAVEGLGNDKPTAPYELSLAFQQVLDTPNIIAVAADGSRYTGGAHGEPLVARFVWLPVRNEMLTAQKLIVTREGWAGVGQYIATQLHDAAQKRTEADKLPPPDAEALLKNADKMIAEGSGRRGRQFRAVHSLARCDRQDRCGAFRVPALPGGAVFGRHPDRGRPGRGPAAVGRPCLYRAVRPVTEPPCLSACANASKDCWPRPAWKVAACGRRTSRYTTPIGTRACWRRGRWGWARATWTAVGMPAPWTCSLLHLMRARLDERVHGFGEIGDALRAKLFNLQAGRGSYEVGKRHYDLGNDLYQAMLGQRLVYSCGYWAHAEDLDAAQEAKLDLICRKLGLRAGQRVLDIGCGWGEALKFAAERYGVTGVGITISAEQAQFARELCAGLPIEIRLQDYRELDEPFDAVFSVGMFEHVGEKNYRHYFEVARAPPARRWPVPAGIPSAATSAAIAPTRGSRATSSPTRCCPRSVDRRGQRRPVRDGGLAQLRRRLRPHPAGLAQQHRGGLAATGRPLRRTFPAHVAVLPGGVDGQFPLPPRPAMAAGAVARGRAGRLHVPALSLRTAAFHWQNNFSTKI